jgi:hypothetical protein
LAITQSRDAGTLQRSRVNKHILSSVVGLNEAEPLLVVVELHYARGHSVAFDTQSDPRTGKIAVGTLELL